MRTLRYFLALCLLAGSAFAQSSLPACQGSQERWTNCFGTLNLANGNKFDGEFKNGKLTGQGTYTVANGDKYVGEFISFAANGQGIEYNSSGSITRQGRWQNNRLVQSFAVDAQRFPFNPPTQTAQPSSAVKVQLTTVAQSQLPACQGSDVSKWTNCFGTFTLAAGAKYVGEFKSGKYHGQGTHTMSNGAKYIGEFNSGKYHGQGTHIWANGARYVGEWRDDLRNGQGIEYLADGTIINSGQYADGKRGQSFAIDTNRFPFNAPIQTAQPSSAEKGQLSTAAQSKLPLCQGSDVSMWTSCFGTETSASGTKYVGEYENGWYHGQGTFTFSNGDKYVGEFKYNDFNGQGTYTLASGNKYIGGWENDKRNGRGIEYDYSGSITKQGRWENGSLVQSFAVDAQRFPFNSSLTASVPQAALPDPVKAERDRLAADLEASRKKQQELEEQLRVSQAATAPNIRPTQSASKERRVALVIGNAAYKINPLKNPVNDSTDIAQSLRAVGFDVIEVNNATLVAMREATRRFADKLVNSDVGLVYYSGHGVEVKGKNYLIPVNADIKREYEVVDQAFDASQFLEMMDSIRGPNNKRVNILLVDACRNNELQRSWRSTSNGLGRMDAPGGTFISFATAPGRVAADGLGRNSPYTKHLLQALKQPNMPIEQVFKVVRRNVMDETKGEQIPWDNSSLVGDFFFTVQK